jgi:NTE family protein
MTYLDKTNIKNLALCGGGFYGYAEVGVLTEIAKYSEHIKIENISGVSVGSMIAALYAIGYTPEELKDILFEMDFDYLIRDTMMPYINLYGWFGMYEANRLEEFVEKLISQKTHIKNCTFSQISLNLSIVATNLNYQRPIIFSKEKTPLMVVSKAVRMSISYPGIITPVLYDGDYYGDGGEFMNYPIVIFDKLMESIGITFTAHNENSDGTLKHKIPINNIYDYVKSLAYTMTRAAYISQITTKYLDRSINVHIKENIDSMQFKLTGEQKKYLYQCGVDAVDQQIKKFINVNL